MTPIYQFIWNTLAIVLVVSVLLVLLNWRPTLNAVAIAILLLFGIGYIIRSNNKNK